MNDLSIFGFQGTNVLWDAVMEQLKISEEVEVSQAIDIHPQGEHRAYLAGKAAALMEFREHLESLRRQARD
tara:strand:+ start:9931 stop:10143 length:213 start_codon:yes stop_codon:yes gene_type:complete